MKRLKLYNAITNFADKHKCHKFNDEENHSEYMNIVDICIDEGLIPKVNRTEFSTHARLKAAITYVDNRIRFCDSEV